MFKNIKKVLFALVLALVTVFAFACGDDVVEANKENCKDFCEECPTCAPEANDENCKDFCETCPEINDEACKDFQDFVAPESFYMDVPNVKVGETTEVYLDEFDPEDAYQGLVYTSSNPEIATVDAKGVVTGVRPGKCTVTATSVLDPEVSVSYEFEVEDALSDLEVLARELAYLQAQLPNFVTETYEFPKPWNTSVEVVWMVNGVAAADGKLVVADLTGDVKNTIAVQVTYNGESDQATGAVVWSVKDANVNSFTRIEKAVAAADALMAEYALAGAQVTGDLSLPATIFGCAMNWATSNGAVIDSEGKYTRPLDDKAITLSINATYGDNIGKGSYNVVAKGYSKEEKADYIMANVFANLNGKEVNTDLVLPEFDNLFGAKLSYESKDTAVYGNDGKLVAAVKEAKEVKFEVTIKYDIAGNAADNFEAKKELVVKAVPANKASEAVQAWLASDAGKKYAAVAHTPYGTEAGNVLDLPTEGYAWNADAVKLAVKNQAEDEDLYNVFTTVDGKVKLNAQYLRYTLVNLTGVYTAEDGSKANISLFLNVGVSETPMVVYTGTWRSSNQEDGSLSEIQGKYDLVSNVSYFDKKVGNVTSTYGSGYWSGYVLQAEVDGQLWESYIMELMTAYIVLDEEGNATFDVANLTGGNGGNWGVFFVNNTGQDVNIEVGTYGTTAYQLADGSTIASYGSRNNLAIDGYAPGFIVDAEGNVVAKSTDDKLEYNMANNKAYVGGKTYAAGAKETAEIYAGMADEFKYEGEGDAKTPLWKELYKASDNIKFVVSETGTFKKVEETAEDGTVTVTYVALTDADTDVTEKYAPTYAKDSYLTKEQYDALTDDEKKLVVFEYEALKEVKFVVKNLVGDTSKAGTVIQYLTIPAGGYAMSWKYQFYGVGSAVTLRAFTQNDKVTVKQYDVHALSSMDATSAKNAVANAKTEAAVIAARKAVNALPEEQQLYCGLADLAAKEAQVAAAFDAEIVEMSKLTEADSAFMEGMPGLVARYDALTDEIKANLTKVAEYEAAKKLFDDNCYVITFEWNGGAAEGYGETLTYTTLMDPIELPVPTREGYNFLGWYAGEVYLEVLDTATASNITVSAKWANADQLKLEAGVAALGAADGKEYSIKYYNTGAATSGKDLGFGTYATQLTETGFAGYAIVLGDNIYMLGAGAFIELGKDATAATKLDKAALQPYGSDSDTNNSTGLIYTASTGKVTNRDTFGYGALYFNAGQFDLTFNIEDLYGRTLGGAGYGYERFMFVYDAEKQTHVTKHAGSNVVGTSITLKPGDYVWAPMYAERYSFPLTNSTGANGTAGVLADDLAVKVIDTTKFSLEKNVEVELNGGNWQFSNVEEIKAELLADYNKFGGYEYTLETVPTGAWSNTDFDDMLYSSKELYNKWSWILDFLAAKAGTTTNAGALAAVKTVSTSKELGAISANHEYSVSYEFRGFLTGKVIREGDATYASGKYDAAACADILEYLKATKFVVNAGEMLANPLKAGKVFGGWYSDAEFTKRVFAIEADTKLYAKWVDAAAEVVVEFYINGVLAKREILAKDAAIVAPEIPAIEGFAVKGWSLVSGAPAIELPATATADAKYYACYQKKVEFLETVVDAANAKSEPNVFATLAEALFCTKEGGTVKVKDGTYADAALIEKPVTIVAAGDATISGLITIAKNVDGVTIDGLKFSGKGAIALNNGVANVTVQNCVIGKTQQDGFVADLGAGSVKNIAVKNNVALEYVTERFVRFQGGVDGLELVDNKVISSQNTYDFLNVAGVLKGKVVISGNTFVKGLQSFLYVKSVGVLDCTISFNEVSQIANTFIDMRDMKEDGAVKVEISYNIFKDSVIGWMPIRIRTAGYDANDTISVNVKENKFVDAFAPDTDGHYYINNPTGDKDIYVVGKNLFIEAGAVVTEGSKILNAISIETPYASEAEYDAAYGAAYVEANKALVQEFADEMVALFNATGKSDAVTTTQDSFQSTTHPNVKYVFNNAETLAKYKWFLEYALAEINETSLANNMGEEEYYTDTKAMLEEMISGDIAAIGGNHANGRTCFRQFIHKLINVYNTNATAGNTAYDPCVTKFAEDASALAEFIKLYKANK